ncbi:MAG TPA: iron ABC transporter permease [Bacillota bacterium]
MNRRSGPGRNWQLTFGGVLYWAVLGCFLVPVAFVLGPAVVQRKFGALLSELLNSSVFAKTFAFSTAEAFLSAVGSLLLALPGAYFFGLYNFKGKRYWQSAMVLPFMLPGILVVLGLVAFYGQNGLLNLWLERWFPTGGPRFDCLYGFWGIVIANIFYNFSFCLRILGESWERIDHRLAEAAWTLGSSRWEVWYRIILPLLLPTIGYLLVLVFLYSFLSFTVVLVLGGYLYKTFEVMIYIEYNHKLNFNLAAVLVVVQGTLLGLGLYLQYFFNRRVRVQGVYSQNQTMLCWKTAPCKTGLLAGYLLLTGGFLIGPMLAILVRSLHRHGRIGNPLTVENYWLLFSERFSFAAGQGFGRVFTTSLLLAVGVGFLTTAVAYLLARTRRKQRWGQGDFWLQLPMGISFLTFTVGLSRLGGTRFPSWVLIAWAQFILAFPLVYSILRTAWREVGESLLEAALLLGADRKHLFVSLELPLMRQALITGWSYAVSFSLGDLAGVLMLGKGEVITLSVAIYRLIGHYHFHLATAAGVVFILLSLCLYSLVLRWDTKGGWYHSNGR